MAGACFGVWACFGHARSKFLSAAVIALRRQIPVGGRSSWRSLTSLYSMYSTVSCANEAGAWCGSGCRAAEAGRNN